MSLDRIFIVVNLAALVGWLALAAAPLRRDILVATARLIGAAICMAYVVMFVSTARGAPDLDFDYSLAGIAGFFSVPGYLLVGWIHYLAFDLWIGAWEVEEAARVGLPHWLLLPCLFLTYMLGPVGLLAFLLTRAFTVRRGIGAMRRTA